MSLGDGKDARLVLTTVSSEEEARALAHLVVEKRLAACATILPQARSVYRWEGKIESQPETLVLLKTTASLLESLEQSFAEIHPYDVPEFLAFEASTGSNSYLAWLADSVRGVRE